MPKHSIKIGEVHLESDAPITEEDRKRALKLLRVRGDDAVLTVDDLEVVLSIYRH